MINELVIEKIRTKDYKLIRFNSGLKNDVGELVIDNKKQNMILKKFKPKTMNKIDFYQSERDIYLQRDPNTMLKLLYYDDEQRFLLLEKFEGSDFYIEEIKSSNELLHYKKQVMKGLISFENHFSNKNDLNLRNIDLENYFTDGLEKLINYGFILENNNLIDITNKLSKLISVEKTIISHGSLNPGNILLSKTGDIKFIDFELAGFSQKYYDIGFLLSRSFFDTKGNKELLNSYLNENDLFEYDDIVKIDLSYLANTILLLGLDYETIIERKITLPYKKRFNKTLKNMYLSFSDYEPLIEFQKIFMESIK